MTGCKRSWYFDARGTPIVYWSEIPDLEEYDEPQSVGYIPELILALECLTPKQRFVIERRYGLTDGQVYTHRELADAMGVHHRAVEQHEAAAIRRMQEHIGKKDTRGEVSPSGHA